MSKLDRFLISEGLLAAFLSLPAIFHDSHLSDHRPIIMCELDVDYGLIPFRIYHSWFSNAGFDKLFEEMWKKSNFTELNSIILLKKKFQALKTSIKIWCKEDKQRSNASKSFIQSRLTDLDKMIDQGKCNVELVNERSSLLKDYQDLNASASLDMAQKANIHCPFILNELISWCKHKKTKAIIFKVDFEKAFDSVRAPSGGIKEERLHLLADKAVAVILSCYNDRYVWTLESWGIFSVKSARYYIDDILLPMVGASTRWVNVVPIKINIFAWRVSLDKLPTRLNLSLRGIEIPSILCPICSIAGESSSRLLFSCQVARALSLKVARWWELEIQDCHFYEDWLIWFINLRLSKRLKDILKGVFYTMWWAI
uniref:RNA-directed DNA polymerase, eukaryota n=1 Tax=Tanacetum cinerariifolium TaxID=118510 RepID=A0A6L2N163_TANCI|nr:RNA-directed DNA polymerase, eukaryota [Tanacetum cinerariifolium]